MRILCSVAWALLLAATLTAQTAILTSPARVFHIQVGPQTIVRDASGNLYVGYNDQVQTTPSAQYDNFIGRSTDGGKTWNMQWQKGFSALASGEYGNRAITLAIDGNGNLHCSWWHQATTSSSTRTIRYNRYDAASQKWGAEVTLGSQTNYRSYAALAVDGQDYVWLMHGSTASWRCELKRSEKPFAANMNLKPLTPALPLTVGNQNPDIIIDALNRVHVSYYSYSPVQINHRWLDPGATSPTWSAETSLANSNSTADYYTTLTGDANGNVYAVYGQDVQGGKPDDPYWFIRKWDGTTQTWGSPTQIYKTTRKQWEPTSGQYNDGRVISAACDETTGEVYFVYRDVDAGTLLLARWHANNPKVTTYAKLMNTGTLPPNSRNYFLYPQLRGSLWPRFNRTSIGIDLLYTVGDQNAPTPSYSLYYESFPVGSVSSQGTPKIGTTFPIDLQALTDGGKSYVLALSLTDIAPFIGIDRRFVPLTPDALFYLTISNLAPTIFQNFVGTLDASGRAQAKLAIPAVPALAGFPVHAAFITFPGGPAGVSVISNPFTFQLTK